uniref:Teichoic acid/polysaccharide glycosyl transferase n=1 Tax=uncultured bacterium Contig46 TaxID=1393580 RepID=W0FMW9_9BACT|nr:teichoic acid/polysaccharide glycosyl transferase [uncultured bacterium Contig46]
MVLSARSSGMLRALFACLASFSILAVCTKSSFLYPMNDWVDVNCFFTVGRGILHGLVPYRDLYEQKGPLIYYLFALAGQISESSFLGVYLLEGMCFAWFVYLGGRIAETLSEWKEAFWPSAALLALLVPVTPAFSHGASAEEFFLPVLELGLYLVLKAMHEKKPLTDRQGFALGLCVAAALWTKYTFCGLFAGLAIAVMSWYLFSGKAGQLPCLILFFLLGCLVLSAAVIGWFTVKGALPELWQAYFVNNLSQYSHNIRGGHYDMPLPNLLNNLPWSIPGTLGLAWLAVNPRKHGWEAMAAWLGAGCLFVFTYWNGRRYPYYALVMASFTPPGLAAAASLTVRLTKNTKPGIRRIVSGALGCVLLLAGPIAAFRTSSNTYLMNVRKEEMPQYRFTEIIRQSNDRSLLNYGFLDGGFYFAAGVQPAIPWFCTLNIDLPEAEKSLQECIRQGKTAFVVTRSKKLNNEKYELTDEADLVFEGRNWHYFLYRKKIEAEPDYSLNPADFSGSD